MMNKIRERIEDVTAFELEEARSNNPEFFNSPHEGLGVILEEVTELQDEFCALQRLLGLFKMSVFGDYAPDIMREFKYTAMDAACEAIQIAAMVEKYIQSMEVWE